MSSSSYSSSPPNGRTRGEGGRASGCAPFYSVRDTVLAPPPGGGDGAVWVRYPVTPFWLGQGLVLGNDLPRHAAYGSRLRSLPEALVSVVLFELPRALHEANQEAFPRDRGRTIKATPRGWLPRGSPAGRGLVPAESLLWSDPLRGCGEAG